MGQRLRWGFASIGVAVAALVLRVWGSDFGLPHIFHYDEHFYVNTALKLGTGVLNNPPYAPVGLSNILAAEYGVYYVTGRALGTFKSAQEFEAAFRLDPSAFYQLGRFTSAALGAATVLVLYALGSIIRDRQTGLIAAVLGAVSFLAVRDAHFAVPDVAMPFFVTLAVALTTSGIKAQRPRRVWWGALAGGAAVSMKWTALPVIFPIIWAGLVVAHSERSRLLGKAINRTVLITLISFAAGFVITSPQIVINPLPYLREALGQAGAGEAGGFEIWQVDKLPGWLFYAKTLLYGTGVIVLTLSAIGLVRRIWRSIATDDHISISVTAFPVSYFLLMGMTTHYFARYAIALVPFVVLFAADLIGGVAFRAHTLRSTWGLAGVLLAATAAQPLAASIQFDRLMTQPDTRTQAQQWIQHNIPAGAKIAMDWPTYGPPLSTADRSVPGDQGRVYTMTAVGGMGLAAHPIEWYQREGYDYVIASSFIYRIPLVFPEQDIARQQFYTALPEVLTHVKDFWPTDEPIEPDFIFDEIYGPAISLWQRERPGPVIRIYKVNAN